MSDTAQPIMDSIHQRLCRNNKRRKQNTTQRHKITRYRTQQCVYVGVLVAQAQETMASEWLLADYTHCPLLVNTNHSIAALRRLSISISACCYSTSAALSCGGKMVGWFVTFDAPHSTVIGFFGECEDEMIMISR